MAPNASEPTDNSDTPTAPLPLSTAMPASRLPPAPTASESMLQPTSSSNLSSEAGSGSELVAATTHASAVESTPDVTQQTFASSTESAGSTPQSAHTSNTDAVMHATSSQLSSHPTSAAPAANETAGSISVYVHTTTTTTTTTTTAAAALGQHGSGDDGDLSTHASSAVSAIHTTKASNTLGVNTHQPLSTLPLVSVATRASTAAVVVTDATVVPTTAPVDDMRTVTLADANADVTFVSTDVSETATVPAGSHQTEPRMETVNTALPQRPTHAPPIVLEEPTGPVTSQGALFITSTPDSGPSTMVSTPPSSTAAPTTAFAAASTTGENLSETSELVTELTAEAMTTSSGAQEAITSEAVTTASGQEPWITDLYVEPTATVEATDDTESISGSGAAEPATHEQDGSGDRGLEEGSAASGVPSESELPARQQPAATPLVKTTV
jgi:hypothetical protein